MPTSNNTNISFKAQEGINMSKTQQFQHVINPARRMMTFNLEYIPTTHDQVVDTGYWMPKLIQTHIGDAQLVVSFYKWHQLDNFNPDEFEDQIFWTDASGITHLKVRNTEHKGWGSPLKALGMDFNNSAKLAKRFKEVVRISKFHTSAIPRVKWFTTQEFNEMHYDGMNVISRSFAKKMGLKDWHVRGNFRYLSDYGLVKGDAIIISDFLMLTQHGALYDIVAPKVNLKDEIWTEGWHFTTFNPHHNHTQAMFDVQSASWMRGYAHFNEKVLTKTFTHVVNNALEGFAKGEWPTFMIVPEHLNGAEASIDNLHDMENASELYMTNYLRWQMHGMDVTQSASIMGMAINSLNNKWQSRIHRRDRITNEKSPKMWLPMPHGFYGHVITDEALMNLCGYDLTREETECVFYHEASHSVSIPAQEFVDTFEAHDTWDLDDGAKFLEAVDQDGQRIVIIVRSPNGDGGYSIHKVCGELPTYHTYEDVPVINTKNAPKVMEEIMLAQTIDGMPENTHILPDDYTKEEAMYNVEMQKENPGIGGVANALMTYYACKGKSPEHVLATINDMVDCVQQTPYLEGFRAIKEFTEKLWDEISTYGEVDEFLFNSRVPSSKRETISNYKGYFTRLFNHFEKEANRFKDEGLRIAFVHRMDNPIVPLMEMDLDLTEGKGWMQDAEAEFAQVTRNFPGNSVQAQLNRTKGNQDIIRRMVTALDNMEENEANMIVLAMYRYCLIPGSHRQPHGTSDRALFSPSGKGERCVMDIFIRALMSIGAAVEADINKVISMNDLVIQLLEGS